MPLKKSAIMSRTAKPMTSVTMPEVASRPPIGRSKTKCTTMNMVARKTKPDRQFARIPGAGCPVARRTSGCSTSVTRARLASQPPPNHTSDSNRRL